MKLRTSFLTRCCALVLALALLVSGSNLGFALQAFAADSSKVTVSELVASNYELAEAEKALLNSGLLASDSVTYTAPTAEDGLVAVDTENAKITAATKDEWVPTTAYIVVGGEVKETVKLVSGVGNYDRSVGNAFAVKVDYVLTTNVPAATQESLLGAGYLLKADIVAADTIAAQAGNLYILEQAMPQLVNLAANDVVIPGSTSTVKLSDAAKADINALNAQMKANNGKLDLSMVIEEYDVSTKTQYVLTKADIMQASVNGLLSRLDTINNGLGKIKQAVVTLADLGMLDSTTVNQIQTLADVVNNLKTGLEAASGHAWDSDASHYVSGVDYAVLDTMVAALNTASTVTVNETLKVAETTIQVNLSMFNVTVSYVLNVVEDKADSDKLVEFNKTTPVVLTLAKDATNDEIEAEIAKAGLEAAAKEAWAGTYVEGQFAATTNITLPETLTDDITYVVTYSPVNYKVTCDYIDDPFQVPYGYQLTLPVHEDPTQAYDYIVNEKPYAQGEIVVITGDTTITSDSGKAYASTDLYTVIADNFGNDLAKAILKSGALKNNEIINVRKPDPTDVATLLTLVDGELKANDYSAAYQGLNWVPYTYGAAGTENSFSGSTAPWTGNQAKVIYILTLSNYSAAEVEEILTLAKTLKAEADAQKKTLDSLAGNYEVMGQLDKTKLGALKGAIEVTDFTPDDGTDTDDKNIQLQNYFLRVVSDMQANNLDGTYLKIYNMLGEYRKDGLGYYYNNSAAVIKEVNSLSGYLDELVEEEEALRILVGAAGFPEYANKITGLQESMAGIKASLTAPNAAIDLDSKNLPTLVNALSVSGTVETETAASPYLTSDTLTVMDSSQVNVQVIIDTPEGGDTVTTEAMDKGTVLTAEMISGLKAAVTAKVNELLGEENVKFYNETASESMDALTGTAIDKQVNIYITYSIKEYTVKVDGMEDQTVTINNLTVNLPKHNAADFKYVYTVDGVETEATTYTFTTEQLDRLFTSGSYTIIREVIDMGAVAFETAFGKWIVKNDQGEITGLKATIAATKDGLTDFAMTLVNSKYSYIGLNNESLMRLNAEGTLEISIQTLIDAMLAGENFSSEKLANVDSNGCSNLLTTTMQVGNDEDAIYKDMPFTLDLANATTIANALNTIAPYMTFKSNNGVLLLNVDLPEKVYEAYLAAMLATGNVTKEDIAGLNNDIALQFLWDYIDLILNSDADTETYTNTLRKLGQSYDLTGYEKYYSMIKKALTGKDITINSAPDDNKFDIKINANGAKTFDSLFSALGIDTNSTEMQTYLGMIKEYKDKDATLSINADVNLADAGTAFEAAIIDVNAFKASGMANKLNGADFTTDITARMKSVTGASAVILLSDVKNGNLTFPGTGILDLNGQTFEGNIKANGTLYIIDSSVDTKNCGSVDGKISGNVTILGGNYSTDVSAFLKDGYYMDGTAVRNALFRVEEDKDGNTTVILNADVYSDEHVTGYIPNAQALAIDIACDLLLNHYMSAALTVDNGTLINVSLKDIIGLIGGEETTNNLLKQASGWVTFGEAGYDNNVGLEAFVNTILEKLLDVGTLGAGLENEDAIATFEITTAPWNVELSHVEKDDYITIGIGSNPGQAKKFSLSLVVESKYAEKVGAMLTEMDKIIVDEDTFAMVDIPNPTYAKKQFNISASGKASMVVDMSRNADYATVVGVILASSGASQEKAIVAAINNNDRAALQTAINNTTVQELITALKAMARNTDYEAMCEKAGIKVEDSAKELEGKFHLVLCGIGKGFEVAKINGMNKPLSTWLKDGYYSLNKENISRDVSASAAGYTALISLTADEIDFKIKLFGDCLWGDVNHDGKVNSMDANAILRYSVGLPQENDDFFCEMKADVNCDGLINSMDANAILKFSVGLIPELPVPVEE